MKKAHISRKTSETDVTVILDDKYAVPEIDTGIGFFDHMLTAFATHGRFGMCVKAKGDLQVDMHHTVEDVGIVLGKAFYEALGDKAGIERFGSFYVPMDEALAFSAVDISGRPFLVFDADFPQWKTGEFDCCLCEEFFRAFAFNSGITLHIKMIYASNSHHIIEAIFKAVGHAVRLAIKTKDDNKPLSTKGSLD